MRAWATLAERETPCALLSTCETPSETLLESETLPPRLVPQDCPQLRVRLSDYDTEALVVVVRVTPWDSPSVSERVWPREPPTLDAFPSVTETLWLPPWLSLWAREVATPRVSECIELLPYTSATATPSIWLAVVEALTEALAPTPTPNGSAETPPPTLAPSVAACPCPWDWVTDVVCEKDRPSVTA